MSLVTIQTYNLTNYHGPSHDVTLRLVVPTSFIASDGTLVQGNSNSFYKEIPCTVSGTTLTIPQIAIQSTTDALNLIDGQLARYSAFFYSSGKIVAPFSGFQYFKVPPVPNPTTWSAIAIYSTPIPPNPLNLSDFYTKDQVNALIAMGGGGGGGVPTTRQINTSGGLQGGGDLSVNRTHSLTDKTSAGTYAFPVNLTVDSKGRIDSVSSGPGGLVPLPPNPLTATNATVTTDVYGRVTALSSGASPGLGGSDFELETFGGAADGVTDNLPAFNAFIAHLRTNSFTGATLRLRRGTYLSSGPWVFGHQLRIVGAGPFYSAEATKVLFAARQKGLINQRIGEVGGDPGADGCIIEDIYFSGQVGGSDGTCNVSGNTVTRVTGPSFTSVYLNGCTITINGFDYPIGSIPDGDHLTIAAVDMKVSGNGTNNVGRVTSYQFDPHVVGASFQVIGGGSYTVTSWNDIGNIQVTPNHGISGEFYGRLAGYAGTQTGVPYVLNYRHGFELHVRASIRNCQFGGFAGQGICGDSTRPAGVFGCNINLLEIQRTRCVNNHGHGFFITGNDGNASNFFGLDCSDNNGWGVYDSSFLGNAYYGCHTIGNYFGSYNMPGPVISRTSLFSCYQEDDQVGVTGGYGCLVMGGTINSMHPESKATIISAFQGTFFQSSNVNMAIGNFLRSSSFEGGGTVQNLIGDVGTYVQVGPGPYPVLVAGDPLFLNGGINGVLTAFRSSVADPTTSNVYDGNYIVWHNTSSDEIRIWANNGGVLKKSAPLNGGSGGGSPGGSNTQLQYNSSGAFGGAPNLTWDGTRLGIGVGQAVKRTAVSSSPYNILNTDYYIGVDTFAPRTLNLPNTSLAIGQQFTIADESGTAGTNNITVNGNGANIDGASSWVIDGDFSVLSVMWTGTFWKVK